MNDKDIEYIDFPLIKENRLEKRLYQETILYTTVSNNTLVVLPTGMGKTVSALLLAAHRLNNYDGKVLFLAPTRPLVQQHKKFFEKFINIGSEKMVLVTGKIKPEDREAVYEEAVCIFATPQVIKNDIENDSLGLEDLVLIIFDECHRGVGDYAYPFIAEKYVTYAQNPRILGLTASPGGDKDKIKEVMENLYLEEVEVRTEEDEDVKQYTMDVKNDWRLVELPDEFKKAKKLLEEALERRRKQLKRMGHIRRKNIYKKDLLKLQRELSDKINSEEADGMTYAAASKVAEALKIEHGISLLETQGNKALYEYLKQVREEAEAGKTRASKTVMKDGRVNVVFNKSEEMLQKNITHPKLDVLKEVVREQIKQKQDSKIMVFSNYRLQGEIIYDMLDVIDECDPVKFVGQAGDGGLSQDEQIDILEKFEEGGYNVLISTSVGEEGLDVPAVDLVIFYEPIPSEIRTIQRRGRTGRQTEGKVVILVTKDTRDEAYYWSSKHKERKMKNTLKDMKNELEKDSFQTSLDKF